MVNIMDDKAFNLLEEKWIYVMLPDCSIQEVSLTEALLHAHRFKGLAGEMEAQNVALLRLLIAITHTIFTRVNLMGEPSLVDDEETAVERWDELMKNGCLPEKPVLDYLEKWKERFWLVHPEYPFYQAPLKDGTENTASKLNGEVSESNNKPRLFGFLSGRGKETMSYAEAARWLLFINSFDDCAAKQKDKSNGSRSMSVGWLGKLGLVTAEGDTLFETVLLNMPMLLTDESLWPEDDHPVWEAKIPCVEERRTIPMPEDLASLFTLQSRRILLLRDNDRIIGYKLLGGDAFQEQNAMNEPMTLWKYDDKKKPACFYPRRHERTRQMWREFGSIVNKGNNEIRPGVVTWCAWLKQNNHLPHDRYITFRSTCVRYDSSQFSSITDSFSDMLSFRLNLLTDAGTSWIRIINNEIGLIDQTADEIGRLALNIAKACGQTDDSLKEGRDSAKERFYLAIDLPFREWLMELDPDQDSDERNELIRQWAKTAKQTAFRIGRQLVDEKGEIAFIGRTVKENKKERHYSSPEAYNWFKYKLNCIYPSEKGGNEQNE